MSEFFFKKTLVIGLGLIGGSFAKSLKKHQLSQEIFAFDLDENVIAKAQEQVVINGSAELENDLSSFDFIVIATPLAAYKEVFFKIKKTISKKAIIIDLGSVKSFIKDILPLELKGNFVGCHPIAGLETSGFDGANADLFVGKKFVICDKNDNSKIVENLVKKMGCEVDFIESKAHDEIYGLVSHLPQFLSFLTREFLEKDAEGEFFKRAFRLDRASPAIWEDIFKFNEKNLEGFYLEFFDNLVDLIEEMEKSAMVFGAGDRKGRPYDKNPTVGATLAVTRPEHHTPLNQKFLEENFPPIFFRFLVVSSYLKIKKIPTYQPFAGSGFKDFTLIMELLKYDHNKLSSLVKKHQQKIIKIFESIS